MRDKTALIVVHQKRSSTGDVGRKLINRGYKLDIRRPVFGEKLPDTMDNHDLAVIYGGPPSANDDMDYIKYEVDWISKVLKDDKPFLGICLGGQMLAKNLGGEIKRSQDHSIEVGFYDLKPKGIGHKIFKHQKTFFQWHREGFRTPQNCEVLAEGDRFRENAFRYGKAYGIQFHPEVNLKMHSMWLHYAGYMTKEKGAQARYHQMNLRQKHAKKISMWLDTFIDNYLIK
tara:strand:+ start:3241 stop:3927 length:687 start_codon:yes stop_codon:yes gene_type:complete